MVHGRDSSVSAQSTANLSTLLEAALSEVEEAESEKSQQPKFIASAASSSLTAVESASSASSAGTQSKGTCSTVVSAQKPALGDHLELECSSIAIGGQVRDPCLRTERPLMAVMQASDSASSKDFSRCSTYMQHCVLCVCGPGTAAIILLQAMFGPLSRHTVLCR